MKRILFVCSMFIFMFTTFAHADISHHNTCLFSTRTEPNLVEAKSTSHLPKLASARFILEKKLGAAYSDLTFGRRLPEPACELPELSLPNHCIEATESCEKDGVTHYSSSCKTCSQGYEVENGICKIKDCSNYPSASGSITGCARTSECQSALQITYKCEECNAQGWESDGNGGCKPLVCDDDEFPYVKSPTICKGAPLSCPTGDEIHYGCADCNPGYIQNEGYCVETGGGSGGSWEGCQLAAMPEIFDGKGNTQKIVAQMRKEALAAYACSQFYAPGVDASDPTFGQGKWHLPAIGELMEVYGYDPARVTAGNGSTGMTGTNKTLINNALTTLAGKGVDAAALTNDRYWSSSEIDSNYSWLLIMSDGSRSYAFKYGTKGSASYVRSFLLLENAFNPSSASIPQVGDVMYADKSWGAASDVRYGDKYGSKGVVGVITYVSPTSGYVVIMNLKDLAFSSKGTVGNFNPATPYTGINGISVGTTMWSTTNTDITALTNYDADGLLTAIQNDTRAECTGGGSGGGKNSISFEVASAKDGMEFTVEMGVKEGTAIIDWGDGNTEKVEKDGSYSHAYKSSGKYTVVITGEATAFAITKGQDYVTKLLDISLPSITSYNRAFSGCGYMTGDLSTMTFPSGLTNGNDMFRGCRGLTGSIPTLPSGLTDGSSMFSGCSGLTGSIPALPSGLTNGASMFLGCSGLTGSIPTLPSGLTDGNGMFERCSGLTGNIPALPSGLTNGYSMFSGCSGLTGQCPTKPDRLTAVTSMYADTGVCCDYGDATATNCSGGGSGGTCELTEMPEIFDGKGNTQKIVAQLRNQALAAYACSQFYAPGVSASDPTFGQGQWYLPAIGELMEVYGYDPARVTAGNSSTGATGTNKTIINNALTTLAGKGVDAAALTNSPYSSSFEHSGYSSWLLNVTTGYRTNLYKTNSYNVRSFLLLENCFTPLTLSAPQVGDVMYADKSWGVAGDYDGTKTAVGVITYVSPTSGYVVIMSLKDLAFSSSGTVGNFNSATPYTGSSATTKWSTTSTDITALTNYDSKGLLTAIQTSTRPECTGGSGGGNVPDHAFAFEVTASRGGESVALDVSMDSEVTIDWGDGNTETINTNNQSRPGHTYASAGTYNVYVTGNPTRIQIYDGQQYITRLIDISLPSITSYSWAFASCKNMTGDLTNMEFPSGLTDGSSMFTGCTGLTGSIPELPSGLTDGTGMFKNCSGLTGSIPELPSGLTDGSSMFFECSGLTGSIPALPSRLEDGRYMFNQCTGLTGSIPALPSGLTKGEAMFYGCSGLTGNIPQFPSGLTDGSGMFTGCTGLTGNIPALPSRMTNGSAMFSGCSGLSGNIPTLPSGLTDGSVMFTGCTGLTGSIPALPSGLTEAYGMFYGCSGLSGNIPTLPSSLTNGTEMFYGCSGLSGTITDNNPTLPSRLTNGYSMFSGCSGLSGQCPTKPASLTTVTKMYENSGVCCNYGDAPNTCNTGLGR